MKKVWAYIYLVTHVFHKVHFQENIKKRYNFSWTVYYSWKGGKKELQSKHKNLLNEHQKLKGYLKSIKDKNSKHKLDQLRFNEKIDELNQETDILLDEIDKWQM